MKNNKYLQIIIKNIKLPLIGMIFGAVCGYLYYYFKGCDSGCLIKSNPWLSTIWGGIMGYLIIKIFKNK